MSQRTHHTRIDAYDPRIRHHLEEASTHIAAVKQLINKSYPEDSGEATAIVSNLTRIGLFLKKLYIRHGGIEH